MNSQYLSDEQVHALLEQHAGTAATSASGKTSEASLTLKRNSFGTLVDAVISAYIATLPCDPATLVAELRLLEELCSFYANWTGVPKTWASRRILADRGSPEGALRASAV